MRSLSYLATVRAVAVLFCSVVAAIILIVDLVKQRTQRHIIVVHVSVVPSHLDSFILRLVGCWVGLISLLGLLTFCVL